MNRKLFIITLFLFITFIFSSSLSYAAVGDCVGKTDTACANAWSTCMWVGGSVVNGGHCVPKDAPSANKINIPSPNTSTTGNIKKDDVKKDDIKIKKDDFKKEDTKKDVLQNDSTGANAGSVATSLPTDDFAILFQDANKFFSCESLNGNEAGCTGAVFYSSISVCPTDEPLCAYYAKAYSNCVSENTSLATTLEKDIRCVKKACTWIPNTSSSSDGICASKEALTFPLSRVNTADGIRNYSFDTANKGNALAFIKDRFLKDIADNDFYLSKFSICDFKNSGKYADGCLKSVGTLDVTVEEVGCNYIENTDLLYATIANNGNTMKNCFVYAVKVGTDDSSRYIYDDTSLGFLPFSRKAVTDIWTFDGYDKKLKRGSRFCSDVVGKRFKVTPEALTAWAMLGNDDFYSKGNLKIVGKDFPTSVLQLFNIVNSCSDQEKILKDWAETEHKYIKSYIGGNNSKIILQTNIYKVACSPGFDRSPNIPQAYKDNLHGRSTIKDFCNAIDVEVAKVKTTSLFDTMKNFIFKSAIAATTVPDVSGKAALENYLISVNKLGNPVSKTARKQVKKDIRREKNGTCKDPKRWTKSFVCSIDAAAISGAVMGSLQIANFWLQVKQWKEDLALQKKIFEEGDCYPYKDDHIAGTGITIPFTIAGVTQTYDMYQFCRLTASGALQFMDTCGSLVANKAPQVAIDACYGIQARSLGTFTPGYTVSTAAANNNNATTAAANNNNTEKKKDDAAAAATTSGAATGSAANPTSTDKEKKASKSPYDSVYSTPYGYSTPSKGFQERGYQYPSTDQASSNNATTSANKTVKTLKAVPGPTIDNLVTGHKNAIKSNIVGGSK